MYLIQGGSIFVFFLCADLVVELMRTGSRYASIPSSRSLEDDATPLPCLKRLLEAGPSLAARALVLVSRPDDDGVGGSNVLGAFVVALPAADEVVSPARTAIVLKSRRGGVFSSPEASEADERPNRILDDSYGIGSHRMMEPV